MMHDDQPESFPDTFDAAKRRSQEIEHRLANEPANFKVLTGERTTGALHVGHYFGTLRNRVRLQNLGVRTMLVMADYQAITDRDADDRVAYSVRDILLDYMAIGIDPLRTTIFAHSYVSALNQLFVPFLGVVSVAELQRNPTVKEEMSSGGARALNGLMLTYPVHQAADILFCKGNLVPGGKDQLPHIEITRKIARRINCTYFDGENYFPEPDLLIGDAPNLLGIDGRKMSKSYENAIYIKSTEDETARLIAGAKTDSDRKITWDPERRPEVANLLLLLSLCTDRSPHVWAEEIGSGGAKKLKDATTQAVNEYFANMRRTRRQWEANFPEVLEILRAGIAEANAQANETLADLRKAMRMDYLQGAL
jgi:tryptophanyl-tRNA synthetase